MGAKTLTLTLPASGRSIMARVWTAAGAQVAERVASEAPAGSYTATIPEGSPWADGRYVVTFHDGSTVVGYGQLFVLDDAEVTEEAILQAVGRVARVTDRVASVTFTGTPIQPLHLVSAAPVSNTSVEIRFSAPPILLEALEPSRYAITSAVGGPLPVVAVRAAIDGLRFYLITANQTPGVSYTVRASGIHGQDGQEVLP